MTTMQDAFDEGRSRLSQRGGIVAVMGKILKGVHMPALTVAEFGGTFTPEMECQTSWMNGTRRFTMFACVTPFLAFFSDSTSVHVFVHTEVRQVPVDAAFSTAFDADLDIPVYVHGIRVFFFREGTSRTEAVQEAIVRERHTDKVEAYLTQKSPEEYPIVAYACTGCNRLTFNKRSLKTCANCRVVFYCGRACQVADWKEHKKVCAV